MTAGGMREVVQTTDDRMSNPRAPTGAAGGVLAGQYPNPGFATPMATAADLEGKVDKVPGKGLSANDFSNSDVAKLAGVAAQATKNATDAQLRDRGTHTGTQTIATVAGLQDALDASVSRTNAQIDGNLNINGTGRRIIGDFSNATPANRLMLQSAGSNANTVVGIIPNGNAYYSELSTYNGSDPASSTKFDFSVGPYFARIRSAVSGSATPLPIYIETHGGSSLLIGVDGTVLVTRNALGYGAGAGGIVTQPTNKGATVTLNKPSGRIIMSNSALAGNSVIQFIVNNSVVDAIDTVVCNVTGGAGDVNAYTCTTFPYAGGFYVSLRNMTSGVLSDAVQIQFNVIKGATS